MHELKVYKLTIELSRALVEMVRERCDALEGVTSEYRGFISVFPPKQLQDIIDHAVFPSIRHKGTPYVSLSYLEEVFKVLDCRIEITDEVRGIPFDWDEGVPLDDKSLKGGTSTYIILTVDLEGAILKYIRCGMSATGLFNPTFPEDSFESLAKRFDLSYSEIKAIFRKNILPVVFHKGMRYFKLSVLRRIEESYNTELSNAYTVIDIPSSEVASLSPKPLLEAWNNYVLLDPALERAILHYIREGLRGSPLYKPTILDILVLAQRFSLEGIDIYSIFHTKTLPVLVYREQRVFKLSSLRRIEEYYGTRISNVYRVMDIPVAEVKPVVDSLIEINDCVVETNNSTIKPKPYKCRRRVSEIVEEGSGLVINSRGCDRSIGSYGLGGEDLKTFRLIYKAGVSALEKEGKL